MLEVAPGVPRCQEQTREAEAVQNLLAGYSETLMAMAIPGCRRLYM